MDDPAARPVQPVVTLSASYGSGGSLIAPLLATRLGLPLIDRLLTADLSDEAGRAAELADAPRSGEALSGAEKAASPGSRFFAALARGASAGTVTAPPLDVDTDDDLRVRAEQGLAAVRAGAGAVVLGRAGAIVLATRPRALHVRLDGPASRRRVAAATIEGVAEDRAAQRLTRTDRARETWVKRLYRADVTDTKWYHLWIDSTVLSPDAVVDLVELTLARYLDGTGVGSGGGGC